MVAPPGPRNDCERHQARALAAQRANRLLLALRRGPALECGRPPAKSTSACPKNTSGRRTDAEIETIAEHHPGFHRQFSQQFSGIGVMEKHVEIPAREILCRGRRGCAWPGKTAASAQSCAPVGFRSVQRHLTANSRQAAGSRHPAGTTCRENQRIPSGLRQIIQPLQLRNDGPDAWPIRQALAAFIQFAAVRVKETKPVRHKSLKIEQLVRLRRCRPDPGRQRSGSAPPRPGWWSARRSCNWSGPSGFSHSHGSPPKPRCPACYDGHERPDTGRWAR